MSRWLKRLQTRVGEGTSADCMLGLGSCAFRRTLLHTPTSGCARLVYRVPAMDALFEPRAIGAGTILILALRAVGRKRNLFLFADARNNNVFDRQCKRGGE